MTHNSRKQENISSELITTSLKTAFGTTYHIQIPGNVPVRKLIPALASKLGFPVSSDGTSITYCLDMVADGETHRFSDDECLREWFKKAKNSYLVLLPEVTAG